MISVRNKTMITEPVWTSQARRAACARPSRAWTRKPELYRPAKRAFDFAAALLGAILASPVLLAIAIVVRLTSKGAIFYSQERLGQSGRVFRMYKFRTMAEGCERETGPVWSMPGDTRVTTVGKFLRRSHLDELPQLWNILIGEMSLVGPRPERPEIAERLTLSIPDYPKRLASMPGLTGLAQVRLPPDTGLESARKKLAMDLKYAQLAGPWLDARLLACTALFLAGVPFKASCQIFSLPDRPSEFEISPATTTLSTATGHGLA